MTSPDTSLRATLRRVFRLENRRAAVRAGRLEPIDDLSRFVTVYLPPGYDERADRRYPVLYMQDGQNLFEGDRSYIPGQSWRLHEAANLAIGERTALPMIIAGVDHAGSVRIDEYTPTPDPRHKGGGHADEYARMLLEEIKPAIDARYRTIPDDNAVGGSSLGGLVSTYLALRHPDVFRKAAILSPSVWWNQRVILSEVDHFAGPRPKVWLDVGAREGRDTLDGARALRDRLKTKGWNEGSLRYYEDRRGDHSERAWARRARLMLEFLYTPVSS